jgi:hypothetical protein
MIKMQPIDPSSHHVFVAYSDGKHDFWMKPHVPLLELAREVDKLSETHLGDPIGIVVKIGSRELRQS